MKNNKRKSTVLIKLLGPVIAMGLLTMITAVVGLQSMQSVQKASKAVSGNGFRALICLDEINKDFIQTQKYCLAVCGEPDNADLYEYVAGQLKDFQSEVASYEEELLAMDDYFSDSDIATMNAVFSAMDNAQQETVELMTKAMSGDKDIISEANQVMQEWSTNIGNNLDTLITSNDEVIKAHVEKQEKIYNTNRVTAYILKGISFSSYLRSRTFNHVFIFYFIFKIKTVRSDRLYNIHLLIIVKTGFIRKFMTITPVIYIIYTDSLYMFYIIHKNLYLR